MITDAIFADNQPSTFWQVKTKKKGQGLFVLYIQDAYTDEEAQRNIIKILEHYLSEFEIQLVGVEGTAGEIKAKESFSQKVSDQKSLQRLVDELLTSGKITGPEYLNIIGSTPFTLYGCDDHKFWTENRNTFLRLFKNRELYQEEFSKVLNHIQETIKTQIPEKEMVYQLIYEKLSDHTYNFTSSHYREFFAYLVDSDPGLFEQLSANIHNFYKIQMLEAATEPERINQELREILTRILTTLNSPTKLSSLGYLRIIHYFLQSGDYRAADVSDYTKAELENIYSKARNLLKLDFNSILAHIMELYEDESLLLRFTNLCIIMDIPLRDYPNLQSYLRTIIKMNHLKTDLLFDELRRVKTLIIEQAIAAIPGIPQLFKLGMRCLNVVKMISLQATYKIVCELADSGSALLAEITALTGIEISGGIRSQFEQTIEAGQEFYSLAEERSRSLVNNLVRQMHHQRKEAAVLIAGGFHATNIQSELENKNISYMIISPKITKLNQSFNKYAQRLLGSDYTGEKGETEA